MPRGFGRGRFWGFPYWGWGGGRGNPFPFCRNFPWLPRWWWASPNAQYYASTLPYFNQMNYPYGYSGYPGFFNYPGYQNIPPVGY